jgi:type VI secretion system VasD/TssJ family lipoprotein
MYAVLSVASRTDRRGQTRAQRGLVAVVMLALVAPGLLVGCAGKGQPKKVCAVFYASDNLNLFDGEAHPLTVYMYPLEGAAGFAETNVADLLDGELPKGVLQPPVPITVSPSEKKAFEETFPAATTKVGILADYYRGPGDPAGRRTQVVAARCGMRKPKLVLSPKDIYLK